MIEAIPTNSKLDEIHNYLWSIRYEPTTAEMINEIIAKRAEFILWAKDNGFLMDAIQMHSTIEWDIIDNILFILKQFDNILQKSQKVPTLKDDLELEQRFKKQYFGKN